MNAKTLPGVQSASRGSLPLVVMFAVGCLSVFAYSYVMRGGAADTLAGGSAPTGTHTSRTADSSDSATGADLSSQRSASRANEPAGPGGDGNTGTPGADTGKPDTNAAQPDPVSKWTADATGNDVAARASAIMSLANAPKSQALPVLHKVLSAGEPQIDRPLALASLRTLARNEGDADGSIRNVLRETIYHGGDEATTQGAQAALDDVEGLVSSTDVSPTGAATTDQRARK